MATPCSKNNLGWNWQSGDSIIDNSITGIEFPRNIFDCGEYFFDGVFNVVRFKKGLNLYHGSGILANNLIEFPIGVQYYINDTNIIHDTENLMSVVGSSQEEIESIISENYIISPSWYGDVQTAKMYSQATSENNSLYFNEGYVMAYELKNDAVFFLLDDDYNIAKILSSPENIVSTEIKETIIKMFSLENSIPYLVDNRPFTRILYYNKQRKSEVIVDKIFAEWICKNIITPYGYGGYGATIQTTEHHAGFFHYEIIFCNAFKWLKRNLKNENDWQYSDTTQNKPLKELVSEYSHYKSLNIGFHSGNLLEHAVWSLLWAEDIVNLPPFRDILSDEQKRITCLTSFLHDIGKMQPNSSENLGKVNGDIYYFSIKDHASVGQKYVRGVKELISVIDGSVINLKPMFEKMHISDTYIKIIGKIILYHQDFGITLGEIQSDPINVEVYIDNFIQKIRLDTIRNNDTKKIFVAMLLAVSIADMYAMQPYGVNRLTNQNTIQKIIETRESLNARSKYFPEIGNLPKKYAGTDLVQNLKLAEAGPILSEYIIAKIGEM